jgi:leader peptidase (prepilin peptidase)/N-methyltransferase
MGFIGAFLGWQGALFTLAMSSIVGAIVGVTLIVLKKHQWSKWLPYGPYLALAAVLWVFWGHPIVAAVFAFSEMVNRWLFGV